MRWILLLCVLSIIQAETSQKKYNLSVCAMFKNESKNIREWIEYHRVIGVDHFYLYENGATDSYMSVLRPYINRKIVTLIPWPDNIERKEGELFKWSLSTLIPAYENAIVLHAREETEWLAFLDVDEFLLPAVGTMKDILEKYKNDPGILVNTEFFEAAPTAAPSKNLVIESVDLTKAPKIEKAVSVQKMIFKPAQVVGSKWPPYECIFSHSKYAVPTDKSAIRVNRYLNRYKKAIVAKRKLYDVRPSEMEEALNMGYDIEDSRRDIQRFIPEVSKRLSANKEWSNEIKNSVEN
jgi:hypothetical protein